jgi:hypothetical protein
LTKFTSAVRQIFRLDVGSVFAIDLYSFCRSAVIGSSEVQAARERALLQKRLPISV